MIETTMLPVVTPWGAEAERTLERLHVPEIPSGALARALQRHVVLVPPQARERLISAGHAAFAAPQVRGDQFCVLQTRSLYRPEAGLIWEDAEYLAAEQTMI